MKIYRLFVLLPVCLLSGCARTTENLAPVRNFDLQKYIGTWYEAARLPHRFEKGMQQVKAEYTLQPNGTVRVVNSGFRNGKTKQIVGTARMKNNSGTGELEVSFFRPFYGDYKILFLDPGYTRAVVTSGTFDYLWILIRDPADGKRFIPEAVRFASGLGFDCSRIEYPEMISAPPGS